MNNYNNQINSLVDFETLAQEAYSSILDVQAEKIAQNHNMVSNTLNNIINTAKSLYDDGPLLSVNSTFLNDENTHAVEAVKHLQLASENMLLALQECNKLKEALEKRRTGVLANYEQELRFINEEKDKAIKLAEDQILQKTNQAKQTMLLSSSTACNLLLDPEHLALNFTRGDFNFINEGSRNNNNFIKPPMKKENADTSSMASSGFFDDDDDRIKSEEGYEHSFSRSRSTSRTTSNRQPLRKPTQVPKHKSSSKSIENRMMAKIPPRIQNEYYGRVFEPQPSSSFNNDENSMVTFDSSLFGAIEVDPLKITNIERESPVLSTSLAATFILSNLKTIDKQCKLAEALYDTCRFQFINHETMYNHVAKRFGISPNTFVDLEIISFPMGVSKINTLINRFNDELVANGFFNENKVYNNALVVANVFVHLAKFSLNAYYNRFLTEVKVEPY